MSISKKIIFMCVVILIAFIAIYLLLSPRGFRVTSTNPSLSSVSTSTPFLKISFSEPLSRNGLSFTYSGSIVSSYNIESNSLNFSLNGPLNAEQSYYIKVARVESTNGSTVVNKTFSFSPKIIPFQSLPKDQQAVILKGQTQKPSSKNNITFVGLDALINYGLTESETNNLEGNFYSFNSRATSILIDQGSINPVPHDPNSTTDTMYFNVVIDSKTYRAKVDYFDLTQTRLYLYNSSGELLFDSGSGN